MESWSFALLVVMVVANGGLGAVAVLSPDDCSQEVNIPELSFSPSSLSCAVVWKQFNFVLRHKYDESTQRLSLILSVSFASNWFSIGFSPTGYMVGSSALVGYMSVEGGNGVVKQYYLAGKTSDQVLVHQGNLTLVPNSGVVTLQNQTTYLAIQIDMHQTLASSSKVIYAYGYTGITPNSSGYIEGPHRATSEMSFDFTSGSSSVLSSPTETLRRSHGAVNIIAWAVLAPVGAFIARYLRQREGLWFPLHIGFQVSSYVLGIVGVALGIRLTKDLPAANWKQHRIVGVSVLFLATLQVLAICARPHNDSKHRKIWGWYHFIVGRFVLLLAAVNIVVGIRIADAGRPWQAGYALILVITLLSFFVLETMYWCKWRKKRQQSRPFSSYEMM